MEPIIKNPKSIKGLADEIKRVCDAYWGREMTESEAKGYIEYWANKENRKFFRGPEINPTIKIKIGKKREELITKWLEGTQIRM